MKAKQILLFATAALSVTFFSGCATMELQTQTKMTQSIFMDPVKKENRTIFVGIRNTSGQDVEQLEPMVVSKLSAKGYKVVDDPDTAKYVLMANVLFANNLKEAQAARAAGQGAVMGGVMGAIGSGGNGGSALVGALTVGLITGIAGKITEDSIYQMVTDVVVRDRKNQKVVTTQGSSGVQASIGQSGRAGFANTFGGSIKNDDGAGGKLNDNSVQKTTQQFETDYVEHKTKIFSEAVKMGLKIEEALPVLIDKMATQIVGIF